MLNTAIDGAALYVNPQAPPLTAAGLEALARRHHGAAGHRCPLVPALPTHGCWGTRQRTPVDAARFATAAWIEAWTAALEARLNAAGDVTFHYELRVRRNAADQPTRIRHHATEHGGRDRKAPAARVLRLG